MRLILNMPDPTYTPDPNAEIQLPQPMLWDVPNVHRITHKAKGYIVVHKVGGKTFTTNVGYVAEV